MRHPDEERSTFSEMLSELADQHELELANLHEVFFNSMSELKAENASLIKDRARLNDELATLRKSSNSKVQSEKESSELLDNKAADSKPSGLVLLPGQVPSDKDDIEVVKLPELQADSKVKTVQHSSGPLALKTVEEYDTEDNQVQPQAGPRSSMASTVSQKEKKKNKKRSLFPDTEELKNQVREAVAGKPRYNVTDLYKETGFCQRIARSHLFENITFVVIFAVTIYIAVDTDLNNASILLDADPFFVVGANSFCAYFTFELAMRFGAFRRKRDCFKDPSFIFDSLLVLQDVLETWCLTLYFALSDSTQGSPAKLGIFRVVRMAKLFRMARAGRLMRAVPEIAILVKGIGIATRSVFFTLFLLMLVIYVFAVVFRQLTDGTEMGDAYFTNVAHSMNSLLLDGVLPDNAAIVNDLAGQDWYLWPIIMFFILLASLTVMNMLVGVLVEVVGAVAEAEKECMAVGDMKDHLSQVMQRLDFDQSGFISKAEFDKILVEPEAAKVLTEVGVDVVGLVDLSDFLFEGFGGDNGELDLEEFMNVVLDLRETNTAKVKDVVMLQKLMKRDMRVFHEHIIKAMLSILAAPGATLEERISSFNADGGIDCRVSMASKLSEGSLAQSLEAATKKKY